MRHGVKNKKLGVNAEHKRAILRNLAISVLTKGLEEEQSNRAVRTTLHKAKLVRGLVERMITFAKKGDLSARRQVARYIKDTKNPGDVKLLHRLFEEIGPRYASRNGGYTRILKLGPNRPGDAAEMALISLVEDEVSPKVKKAKSEKGAEKKIDMVEGASKVTP